jgi:uncharacterized protein YlxW (UPF0749 family)
LKAPYVIDAIGNSHTLATALDFSGGFVDEVERDEVDGEVQIRESDHVEISTVVEPGTPRYAKPAPTG